MPTIYLTTTKLTDLQPYLGSHQVFMVDGSVPGFQADPGSYHWDHHRPGGGRVQLEEMPELPGDGKTLLEALSDGRPQLICTTKLDADAQIAAAWLQLRAGDPAEDNEIYEKFYAIAHDCDYLTAPKKLPQYEEFAATVVAALKAVGAQEREDLGLPRNTRDWDPEMAKDFFSDQFRKGTEWLVAATKGEKLWPGEEGEAGGYWENLQRDAKMLAADKVSFIDDVPVIDLRQIRRYVDSRAGYMAVNLLRDIEDCRPQALTIGEKEFGIQFILGSNPAHSLAESYDYSAQGVWRILTKAEALKRGVDLTLVEQFFGTPQASERLGFDPWGGRSVVGGSGWNTPSKLSPEEVVHIVIDTILNNPLNHG